MLTTEEAEHRVSRGAAYLDRTMPGWAARVDPNTLRLRDGCQCVLGQLEGSFAAAVERRNWSDRQVIALGFWGHLDFGCVLEDFFEAIRLLEGAWIAAIADRLTGLPPAVDACSNGRQGHDVSRRETVFS